MSPILRGRHLLHLHRSSDRPRVRPHPNIHLRLGLLYLPLNLPKRLLQINQHRPLQLLLPPTKPLQPMLSAPDLSFNTLHTSSPLLLLRLPFPAYLGSFFSKSLAFLLFLADLFPQRRNFALEFIPNAIYIIFSFVSSADGIFERPYALSCFAFCSASFFRRAI